MVQFAYYVAILTIFFMGVFMIGISLYSLQFQNQTVKTQNETLSELQNHLKILQLHLTEKEKLPVMSKKVPKTMNDKILYSPCKDYFIQREKTPIRFFFLITSGVSENYAEQRKILRETWLKSENFQLKKYNEQKIWDYRFIIGMNHSSGTGTGNISVDIEAKENQDMLICPFTDTYNNLTTKTIFGLSWAMTHTKADFVIKVDDDCFVSKNEVFSILDNYHQQAPHIDVWGLRNKDYTPARSGKWAVSKQLLPDTKYDITWVNGWFYALTRVTVAQIVAMYHFPHFENHVFLEDITIGFILSHLDIQVGYMGRLEISCGKKTDGVVYHYCNPEQMKNLFLAFESSNVNPTFR